MSLTEASRPGLSDDSLTAVEDANIDGHGKDSLEGTTNHATVEPSQYEYRTDTGSPKQILTQEDDAVRLEPTVLHPSGRGKVRFDNTKALLDNVLAKRSEVTNERGKLNQRYLEIYHAAQVLCDYGVNSWSAPADIEHTQKLQSDFKELVEAMQAQEKVRMAAIDSLTWLEIELFQEERTLSKALEFLPEAQYTSGARQPSPSRKVTKAPSVGEVDPLLLAYQNRKGDENIWRERLQELQYNHGQGREQREFVKDRGDFHLLHMTDEQFEAHFQRRRATILQNLESAEKDALAIEKQCRAKSLLIDGDQPASSSIAGESVESSAAHERRSSRHRSRLPSGSIDAWSPELEGDVRPLEAVTDWLETIDPDAAASIAPSMSADSESSSLYEALDPKYEDKTQASRPFGDELDDIAYPDHGAIAMGGEIETDRPLRMKAEESIVLGVEDWTLTSPQSNSLPLILSVQLVVELLKASFAPTTLLYDLFSRLGVQPNMELLHLPKGPSIYPDGQIVVLDLGFRMVLRLVPSERKDSIVRSGLTFF
ncbi:hypothetical protein LTR78_003316 [Recurvomyces mirabilis]|uniref:Uncharacterized protein n=1 Tax=Recurvomyces mirabilis TaxID=574656 RepID=A0AAE0WS84_9PEZI|nr:hypothetical protein LTR78_003316 [Recurvomyces mirabilis]